MAHPERVQTVVFIAIAIAVLFTFVWLAAQIFFGVRVLRATERTGERVAKSAVVWWIVSVVGLFTGPCSIVFVLASVAGGFYLLNGGNPTAPTRQAAQAVLGGSMLILLMLISMTIVMAVGGVLG